ncbi:hypothetical protein K470DRAFT_249829 [Piedraia hortae CBS 480.64]|uniref:Cleavage/polyadenylation specificity factor A subunit N-terminal domain-containing protein n=1 Tax=Piedraia hortae CBS 480.64 TaxID=1314780 RepID=A0A6A7BXJ5_9PEZI|nr:hypothetical protein K470DRAFT_249829 [Piedraia hortae CBS 480.64]
MSTMSSMSCPDAEILDLGPQRFSRPDSQARLSSWRCNLIALSQVYNLFFLAAGSSIKVYIPQYPRHRLPPQPALSIAIPPTSTNLQGYINLREPHSINRILVAPLGVEEILVIARDDGDVNCIYTRHIHQSVQDHLPAQGVRPFFQVNVGMSAWGLAVHAKARLLAISSNRHEVLVFSFGLVDHDGRILRDDSTKVIAGWTNIPCVAFCNMPYDEEGRWLLFTDVSGVSSVVDLSMDPPQVVQNFGFVPGRITGFDRWNAGWIVEFLDPRSFIVGDENAPSNQTPPPAVWNQGDELERPFVTVNDDTGENGDEVEDDDESENENENIDNNENDIEDGDGNNSDNPSLPTRTRPVYLANQERILHPDLPCPILHTSVRHIHILPPNIKSEPVIGLEQPSNGTGTRQRFNMHAYIPHLGILIVASQTGSAAIIGLCKVDGSFMCRPLHTLDGTAKSSSPTTTLHGLTASPIPNARKRWRIIFFLSDWTVLRYEVSRDYGELSFIPVP